MNYLLITLTFNLIMVFSKLILNINKIFSQTLKLKFSLLWEWNEIISDEIISYILSIAISYNQLMIKRSNSCFLHYIELLHPIEKKEFRENIISRIFIWIRKNNEIIQ